MKNVYIYMAIFNLKRVKAEWEAMEAKGGERISEFRKRTIKEERQHHNQYLPTPQECCLSCAFGSRMSINIHQWDGLKWGGCI